MIDNVVFPQESVVQNGDPRSHTLVALNLNNMLYVLLSLSMHTNIHCLVL